MKNSKQQILYQALFIGIPIRNQQGMILFMGEAGGLYCVMYLEGEVHSAVAVPTDMSAFYSWAESLSQENVDQLIANIALNSITLDKVSDDKIDEVLRNCRANTLTVIKFLGGLYVQL